jgi:hypothetical protein
MPKNVLLIDEFRQGRPGVSGVLPKLEKEDPRKEALWQKSLEWFIWPVNA